MTHRILVIEDEKILGDNIRSYLSRFHFTVNVARDANNARSLFDSFKPHAVLLDLKLGNDDGLELLAHFRQIDTSVKIIIMTAFGTIDIAVNAMKKGAEDFITKPVVLKKVKELLEDKLGKSVTTTSENNDCFSRIIGHSKPVNDIKKHVRTLLAHERDAVSEFSPPVLITGETGTGKELIAQALHYGGKRQAGPFVEINCTTLPEHLVESELFGHEKGAFTGAISRKIGLFESAQGGTLFLDEIGDMPISVQLKLLKVLEDKEIRPVGSTQNKRVNVRIVAATNKSLEQMIKQNQFRSDLYFRLSTIQLEMPALRERGDDIVLLANHFLDVQARCYQKAKPTLSDATKQVLLNYDWPGNVRELRNMMEHVIITSSSDVIEPQHLQFYRTRSPQHAIEVENKSDMNLLETEKEMLIRALTKTGWNVSAAARLLGISRDTLRYRIKRFEIKELNSN